MTADGRQQMLRTSHVGAQTGQAVHELPRDLADLVIDPFALQFVSTKVAPSGT
jgi:hypothetical protein